MADDVSEIERGIRSERLALDRNIRELEERAHAATDWRTHYQAHVGVAVAAAFGSALLLGAMSQRQRAAPERPYTAETGRSLLRTLDPSGRAGHQISDLFGDVVGALISVAGIAAVGFVGELIPGFKDQFEARAPQRVH
jgi:hypothetical protein